MLTYTADIPSPRLNIYILLNIYFDNKMCERYIFYHQVFENILKIYVLAVLQIAYLI